MDTINGITDYWYNCSGGIFGASTGRYWVFGGFLSESMPDDTPIVFGRWDTNHEERNIWLFAPEYFFMLV